MPCICAIAGAIPPDYVDAAYSHTEKKASVDAEGNFDPRPVETTKSVWADSQINRGINNHFHLECMPVWLMILCMGD